MSIHDPLLPPPPPPSRRPEPARRVRRPSPAASARILATGLATTAMLGLTTGYAFARKTQPAQRTPDLAGTPSANNSGAVTQTPTVPSSPQTPNSVTPSPNADSQQSVVTSPPVVEIPVPTIAPAQPGNNWSGGNNQPSSGSH